jgi:uncharacterized protein (TIGR00251 family)
MIIEVKVVPNARRVAVEKEEERYKVYVNAPAVDGKANKALIELLADYFKIKKSQVKIIRGEMNRIKIVSINK